jgi:hypothetical protein
MKYTKIIPGYKTDHSAIIFTFATSLAKRGKGYWKFNSQLLRDTDYIKSVKTCITETLNNKVLNFQLFYALCLYLVWLTEIECG